MRHTSYRHPTNGRASKSPPPRRKVVLVVEDHASIGGLVAGLIRQEGYRAVRAWDSQEAIRLARGRQPDLILLDLSLPSPAGGSTLQALRGDEATRKAPIVAVAGSTALSSEDHKLLEDVVTKPYDIDVMLNAVRKALGDPVVEVVPRQYDAQDYFLNGY